MRLPSMHLLAALTLVLPLLLLACAAPAPPPQPGDGTAGEAEAEQPPPDPAALWASCLEDPTRLTECRNHVVLTREDPGLPERLADLEAAHPGSWGARYLAAYYRSDVLGDFESAREGYGAARDLARKAGDPRGEAAALFGLVAAANHFGETDRCIDLLREARVAARVSGDTDLQLGSREFLRIVLKRKAGQHRNDGRYWDERPLRLEVLALAEEGGDGEELRSAAYALAENSRRLGLYDEAARGFAQVMRWAREAGDTTFAIYAEQGLGVVALDAQDPRALRSFESASAAAREAGAEKLEVYSEMLAAVALTRAGRYDEARERLLASLPRAEKLGGRYHLGTLVYLADAERLSGHEEAALGRYRRIMELAAEVDMPESERDALMGLAALQRRLGDAESAIEAARQAEAMVESMRSNVAVSSERTHFLHLRANTYQVLAASLAQRDPSDLAEPFAVIERAHARTLREALAGGPGAEDAGESLDLAAVQSRLAPGELLLEYLLAEEESSLLVIDAEGATFHALPPWARIDADVRAYRDVLQRPASVWTARPGFRRFADQGHELFELLLGPVAEKVASARRLIVVPDRQMHLLPFEALIAEAPRSGEPLAFLGVSHAIEYLPAASLLGRGGTGGGEGSGFGPAIDRVVVVAATRARPDLGLPALKHAAGEVRAVAGAYPEGRTVVLRDESASVDGLLAAAAQPIDVLHLIAHAGVDAAAGPRVLLQGPAGPDAWLGADTLARLEHAPRLAILSACDTAQGKLVGGEGILGLVRAFTLAGSRQVVASLWKVDDARTALLMGRLHEELRAGTPLSEAMRYARAEMVDAGYEHPFHWAGLVLYGPD